MGTAKFAAKGFCVATRAHFAMSTFYTNLSVGPTQRCRLMPGYFQCSYIGGYRSHRVAEQHQNSNFDPC